MSKLPGVNHLRAVKALEKAGFRFDRQGKPIFMSKGALHVVMPRNNPVDAYTMGAIARDAGMSIELVEWSGGATGLDQWLPWYQPFRASWQTAFGSYRRFLYPLYSCRTAGFPQYGWKPALSSCTLPLPFRAAFGAGQAVHPFLAIAYPGVWNRDCAHRPLAQHGLSCPRLQTLLQPDPPA